ncbi:sigma-70 family RNA polymerase sigma factor [Pleionea sp. CnH1-48]|uniref:sigma-70 family RNA polymerase sigma factor n=1 Tax=Pleionea sp. CnH1-48 TaxID=2954494 RepID=UPI00209756B6|nr:sigma-70 family RNA polymerase sigma factor [Pleionea sp. CnH1-48]MCO7223196.1 sigma-70 family RNA polymerase sigma factor [Pleionea sp. CnH1-48]
MNQEQLNQLYRYGLSLTQNDSDAFDLVQSAVEKCLRKTPPKLAVPYVRATMRNHFIDLCRRHKIIAFESYEDTSTLLIHPEELESIIIDQQRLSQLMDQLNTSEREVLFLWAVEEYTAQEISDELNVPRNTILSRLHRVKQKLKKMDSTSVTGGKAL